MTLRKDILSYFGGDFMLENQSKFYITDASFGIAQNIFTGSIIQSFLLESGIAEQNVALYVSAVSTVGFFSMLLTASAADRIKNIIKFNAFFNLCYILFFAVLIFFSFYTATSSLTKYISIFIVGIFINIIGAIRQNISSKLPHHILNDIGDYGPMLGTAGAITGGVGIAFYGIMTFAVNRLPFWTVMKIFTPLGALAIIISFLSSNSYTPAGTNNVITEKKKKRLNIIKCKPFLVLAIPDFLFGFWFGMFGIAAVIGSFLKIVSSGTAVTMMLLVQIFYTVACIFYSKISRYSKISKYFFLASGIITAVLTPLLIVWKNPVVFLIIYSLLALFFYFNSKFFQVILTKIIDYDFLGQYSALYGSLRTLGSLTAAAVTVPLLQKIGGFMTLTVAALGMLLCTTVYFIYTTKNNI